MLEMATLSQEEIELLAPLLRLARGRRGTFLEIGASDGVDGSHSLVLEKCFGWDGILVEAQPQSFQIMMHAPRSVSRVHAAACEEGRNISMSHTANGIGVAMELTTPHYLARWRKYVSPSRTIQVRCRPLGDIVRAAGFSRIDFLSLDVQGAEELTLKTVDPCIFSVIMTEAEATSRERNENVRRMLTDRGFVHRPFSPSLFFNGDDRSRNRPKKGNVGENDLFFHPSVRDDPRPGLELATATAQTTVRQRQVEEKTLSEALSAIGGWPNSAAAGRSEHRFNKHELHRNRIKLLNGISRIDATDLASFRPLTSADAEAVQSRRAAWATHVREKPWEKMNTRQ